MEEDTAPASPYDAETFAAEQAGVMPRDEYYQLMAERGLAYGEAFQVLGSLARSGSTALAQVQLNEGVVEQLDQYLLHPALGDAMMQAVAGVVPLEEDGSYSPYTYMPIRVQRAQRFRPPGGEMRIFCVRTSDQRPTQPGNR